MKQSELIALLGLTSWDPRLQEFFTKYQLGKLPKVITANQMSKHILCKERNISFWFKYAIKNDHFQPAISPKNDDYKFLPYLSSVIFTHVEDSAKSPDGKDLSFWDVIPAPLRAPEAIEKRMGKPLFESASERQFMMPIDTYGQLRVNYSMDRKGQLSANCWIHIQENAEIIASDQFNSKYMQENSPFMRRAYTCIIYWLIQNKYLLLDSEIYQAGIQPDSVVLLDFVHRHLHGHLWDNQLVDQQHLRGFLYSIISRRPVRDPAGNSLMFYIQDLILYCLAKEEAYALHDNQGIDKLHSFLNQLPFEGSLYSQVAQLLTSKFQTYRGLVD